MPCSVGRDRLVLEVDEVVAALFVALGPGNEARHQASEQEVLVGRLLGLAADDQRRPGFVDQDVVDLVDDREEASALHPLVELGDHVVAEVVEAEFVVRAVGDVGRVGLDPRAWPQVQQSLVRGRVARLEDVRSVVGDDPDRKAEEAVDRAHPLGVAAGQVVVDRDDVNASAGQAVERGGEGRGHGLAFAGAHLRDPALVQDDAADELDVEVPHPQGSDHGFACRGEDLRQGPVHGLLELVLLALAAVAGHFAAALDLRVVELVLGRLLGFAGFANLVAQLLDEGEQLFVGAFLHFGFELVGPVHEGLDPPELPVVRVDEATQEAKHQGLRSLLVRIADRGLGIGRGRLRPSASADDGCSVAPRAGRQV